MSPSNLGHEIFDKALIFSKKERRSTGHYRSKKFLGVLLALVFALAGRASDETDLAKAKYDHKVAEVLGDGLIIGYCSNTTLMGEDLGSHDRAFVGIGVEDSGISKIANVFHCGSGPLHKGEAVLVKRVWTRKHGQTVALEVANLPHSITRGVGAFEHESVEIGRVNLVFTSNADVDALIGRWLKFSGLQLNQLGNTASMVIVKQVKLGMSFAEVEEALGVPQTRVDLGGKILYKYKDMTVEFHDGRVTDVR